MNCVDVQNVLPEIVDGCQDSEFQAHLRSCASCADLVSELELIVREAPQLAATEEPPQRVWVKIAAELRAEGIIRDAESPARPVPVPRTRRRWSAWWLVPVAAALVVAGSLVVRYRPAVQVATQPAAVQPAATVQTAEKEADPVTQPAQQPTAVKKPVVLPFPKDASALAENDDQQVLDEMSRNAPLMKAAYENELRSVNSYIRDARAYAEQHPGDEDARQHLMDAYEQKSMLYQLALDHVQ